jgi:alkylation response protein AidB-like acyl-CoA dehydrogenase
VNAWNGLRAKAELKQGTSSPILSLGKLAMSRILHEGARVQGRIVGAEGLLVGDEFGDAADANFLALNAYFTSIGGGTDQIQRNIIGERVLGLPKEPEPERDLPFSQVRKATVAGR